jgi:hypothetical protein
MLHRDFLLSHLIPLTSFSTLALNKLTGSKALPPFHLDGFRQQAGSDLAIHLIRQANGRILVVLQPIS